MTDEYLVVRTVGGMLPQPEKPAITSHVCKSAGSLTVSFELLSAKGMWLFHVDQELGRV